jgi:hypothetical protein
MKYAKFIRNDIDIKILSNYEFYGCDIQKDYEKFISSLSKYDAGVWVKSEKLKSFEDMEIYNSKGEKLSWNDIVLNYLNFLNSFVREQIGVCVEKTLPKILDNELTYLIIQRKNKKDFDENYFIAFENEVIFPTIEKNFNARLAVLKLAEWKNRAGAEILIKYGY